MVDHDKRVHHEKKSEMTMRVRVHHERKEKSDGVRVHHERK